MDHHPARAPSKHAPLALPMFELMRASRSPSFSRHGSLWFLCTNAIPWLRDREEKKPLGFSFAPIRSIRWWSTMVVSRVFLVYKLWMTKKKKEKEKEKETKQNIDVYDARSPRSQWKDETGVIFNCLVKKGNLCQDIVRIIFDYGIVVPELYQGRLTQTLFSARCYKSSGDNKFWPIITRSPARPLKLVCTSGHTMETQITRSHLQFEFVNSHALEVEVQPDRPRTFCLPWITGSQVFGPNFTFVRDADLDCHFKWRRTHSPPNCWCHPISVPKSENDAFVLWVIEV